MQVDIGDRLGLYLELRATASLDDVPLHRECVTGDVAELAEEAYVRGVLAGGLPEHGALLRAEVKARWSVQPLIRELEVSITAETPQGARSYKQSFTSGRWVRSAEAARRALAEEGVAGEEVTVYRALVGVPQREPPLAEIPNPQAPRIADQGLEEYGVRRLGAGALSPERPVLINRRMIADMIQRTESAGANEAGGAVLGKILRLKECLPGTSTPVVTVLSAALFDGRHVGGPASFRFSPDALAESAHIVELRNQGEAVLTAWHSHGWSAECSRCRKEACTLPNATQVSPDDYRVLESLFSSKATLMPIVGRSEGQQREHPAVMVHHWCNGAMRPLRWQEYED